ncbi:hypothetical protein WJ63_16070 [Burkholderia pyrrocinia]|nr:hypothetical protein WJ63_16070 [Burkholderia pyrrocinia]
MSGIDSIHLACPTPAQMLQADMDAAFGPGVVAILDMSVPGSSFQSDVNGTAPNLAPLATRLANLPVHANIVITNSQINDQYLLGQDVATYASWAQKWIGVVTAYGAMPVYGEPNPICRSDMNIFDPNTGTNAMTNAAAQAFLAAGGKVLSNLAAWENYTAPPNAQPWNVAFMSSDCVHPNQAGYRFKEANYLPALLPVVKGLLGN